MADKFAVYSLYADLLTIIADFMRTPPTEKKVEHYVSTCLFLEIPTYIPEKIRGFAAETHKIFCKTVADAKTACKRYKREHFTLFIGAGRPLVPPWSSCYLQVTSNLFGTEALCDMDWYARHDFVALRKGVPEDALFLQVSFLAKLLRKQAYAEAQEYLRQRILTWVPMWHADLAALETELYGCIGDLLLAVLRELEVRLHEENPN